MLWILLFFWLLRFRTLVRGTFASMGFWTTNNCWRAGRTRLRRRRKFRRRFRRRLFTHTLPKQHTLCCLCLELIRSTSDGLLCTVTGRVMMRRRRTFLLMTFPFLAYSNTTKATWRPTWLISIHWCFWTTRCTWTWWVIIWSVASIWALCWVPFASAFGNSRIKKVFNQ